MPRDNDIRFTKSYKPMKTIKFVLFNLLLVICASCSNSNQNNADLIKEIEKNVEATNQMCPMKVSEINNVVFEKIDFDNNTVTYHYTLDVLPNSNRNYKDFLINEQKGMIELSPDYKKLIDALAEIGAKIVYAYQNPEGDTYSIELTNKDLKNIIE